MLRLYNLALPVLRLGVRFGAIFNRKLRSGLRGRATLIEEIRAKYASVTGSPRILIHSASFGELEQAKPVIAKLKERYPAAHIHLTFFSPSGYENAKKGLDGIDVISYLPEDAPKDVSLFLEVVRPDIVLFARYDVWPNLAHELDRRQIPSVVFSATVAVGSRRMTGALRSLHRDVYLCVSRILTVTEEDATVFAELGVNPDRIQVAGDTRFDQVVRRKDATVTAEVLPGLLRERITERDSLVFVVGSSWEADEKAVSQTLKLMIERRDNVLTLLVPHEPTDSHVNRILNQYGKEAIRFSKLSEYNREPIIVVDSIGKLFGLYSVADIAMVGGGFGAGIHNVLEAAVWRTPVIFGPRHERSIEARELIDATAGFSVSSAREFDFVFWRLARDSDLREQAGESAERYVLEHTGATDRVIETCVKLLHEKLLQK